MSWFRQLLRLAAALAVVAAGPALADERILSFRSDITVRPDGWIEVSETITVRAEGREIKRGIFRDFPTDYEDARGRPFRLDFDIQDIRRDGEPEPYHIARLANGVRVYIGDKDVMVAKGQHSYRIDYRTSRQIGFYDDYDELYWNVTGNGWTLPIDEAEAVINLPAGARVVQSAAYTGPAGAHGTDFEMVQVEPTQVRFRTSKTLLPRHGLTIAVAWPKGLASAPGAADRARWFLADNADIAAPVLAVLLTLLYYLGAWWFVGRDPARGVIVPLFEPPANLSPPAARYVSLMVFDKETFAAGVVGLAVKGHLKIIDEPDSDVYRIERRAGAAGKLLPTERRLLDDLFASGDVLVLGDPGATSERATAIAERVSFIRDQLADDLAGEHRDANFVTNSVYFYFGLGLSMVMFVAILVFAKVFGPLDLVGVGVVVAAFLALVMLDIAFLGLLRAPTLAGRRLMDRLDGFKMYLSVAEKDRLALLHPPDMTPELYERYLPYALALGVEQQWSEQLAGALAAAGRTIEDYRPNWYEGRGRVPDRGSLDVGRRMATALPAAIASAARAPGDSSSDSDGGGSSGRGSSGGGGGGGGGGGW